MASHNFIPQNLVWGMKMSQQRGLALDPMDRLIHPIHARILQNDSSPPPRAAALNITSLLKPHRTPRQHIRFFFTATITRSLHAVFTEPIISLSNLYISSICGLVNLSVTTNPYVFSSTTTLIFSLQVCPSQSRHQLHPRHVKSIPSH